MQRYKIEFKSGNGVIVEHVDTEAQARELARSYWLRRLPQMLRDDCKQDDPIASCVPLGSSYALLDGKSETDYDKQAQDFFDGCGVRFTATLKAGPCPPFCDGKHIHGDRYQITLTRHVGYRRRSIRFDFWNSLKDQQEFETTVDPYDVLACISGDVSYPDTFEEWCEGLGYDTDSRKAHNLFKRCRKFAARLRNFFTEDEVEKLAEIQ